MIDHLNLAQRVPSPEELKLAQDYLTELFRREFGEEYQRLSGRTSMHCEEIPATRKRPAQIKTFLKVHFNSYNAPFDIIADIKPYNTSAIQFMATTPKLFLTSDYYGMGAIARTYEYIERWGIKNFHFKAMQQRERTYVAENGTKPAHKGERQYLTGSKTLGLPLHDATRPVLFDHLVWALIARTHRAIIPGLVEEDLWDLFQPANYLLVQHAAIGNLPDSQSAPVTVISTNGYWINQNKFLMGRCPYRLSWKSEIDHQFSEINLVQLIEKTSCGERTLTENRDICARCINQLTCLSRAYESPETYMEVSLLA